MKFAPYNPIADSLQSFIRGFTMPAPSPFTLDRNATGVTVVNTTTETPIYSFTVPAFSVGQDQALRLRLVGDLYNASAVDGVIYIFRIELGGTTIWQHQISLGNGDGTRRPFVFDFDIANLNDTSIQAMSGFTVISTGGDPTVGEGPIAGALIGVILGDSTIDMTADALLEVTVEMDTADAAAQAVSKYSTLEVV